MGAPTGVLVTKGLKPWRGYPSANVIHAVRCHIQMDATKYVSSGLAPSPASIAGHVALTPAVPFHIGTIPAGAVIMPIAHHVIVAFAPGTTPTLDVGVKDAAGTFTAGILSGLATTVAFTGGVISGALMGYTANQLELFVRLNSTGAANTAGEADITIPFYIHKD